MSYKRVSLLVPTRRRPAYLKSFLKSYYATTSGNGDSEIVFRIDYDDTESLEFLAKHEWLIVAGPRRQGYRSLPGFFNEMVRLATGDILICCNDDVVIETPGWARLVIETANRYPDGIFNIGVNTVLNAQFFPFSCVSRTFVNRLGFLNDERLLFSDVFLVDVFKYFNRLIPLSSVTFRHDWAGDNDADATRADANKHEMSMVFRDATGEWKDEYRELHDRVVAEAVARVDPTGELVAGQALLEYEKYDPPAVPGGYWPPPAAALPWSAPRHAVPGIYYHRDETFELFKAIVNRRLPRGRVVLTSHGTGLPALLWGCLYEHVVTVEDGQEFNSIEQDRYRIEFGTLSNAPFIYRLIDRSTPIDALVLDAMEYGRLISPYFLIRKSMAAGSIIVVMNTGILPEHRSIVQPRRFVDDLAAGRLDGAPHRLTHIELPGGIGISYEIIGQ